MRRLSPIRQVPIPNTGISVPDGILQERIRNFPALQRNTFTLSYPPCRIPQRVPRSGPRRPESSDPHPQPSPPAADVVSNGGLLRAILRRLRRREKNEAVREAIEELIEETPESDTPISEDQRRPARQHPEAARQDRCATSWCRGSTSSASRPTRRSTRWCG
jgi:hypothetical protein